MDSWAAFDAFNGTFGSLGTLAPFVQKYNFQNVASCILMIFLTKLLFFLFVHIKVASYNFEVSNIKNFKRLNFKIMVNEKMQISW